MPSNTSVIYLVFIIGLYSVVDWHRVLIFDNNTNFIQGWEKIANFYLELISALNPLTHIVQELCLLLSNLAPCRLPAIAADRDYNDMKRAFTHIHTQLTFIFFTHLEKNINAQRCLVCIRQIFKHFILLDIVNIVWRCDHVRMWNKTFDLKQKGHWMIIGCRVRDIVSSFKVCLHICFT